MISLRGHHLICLQFFRGEGYTGEFVVNLNDVLERMAEEGVVVVSGADDVCGACPNLSADRACLDPGEAQIAQLDSLACETLGVTVGDTATMEDAARTLVARARAREKFIASACVGCEWERVCTPGWRRLAGESITPES